MILKSHAFRSDLMLQRLVIACLLVACLLLLAAKAVLLSRININWDEFYFLSELMKFHRHELSSPLQTQYVHLFGWLVHIKGDEVAQILAARVAMVCLLALTCVSLWYLACRWASRSTSLIAPLAYLSTLPVMLHGASFRSDSMLVLLGCAATGVISRGVKPARLVITAVLLGLAGTITIKAAFLIPVLAGIILFEGAEAPGQRTPWWRRVKALFLLGLISASVFLVLLAAHSQSLGVDIALAHTTVNNAVTTTLLEAEPLPGSRYLTRLWFENRFYWLLLLAGAVAAVIRRNSSALACALSLLPIVLYRNAFPYYFVVMLATASALIPLAVDALTRTTVSKFGRFGYLLPLLLAIPLLLQARGTYLQLQQDTLARQRQLISAVHQIFPQTVSYIDHSGMIASFSKANFFMTRWGMGDYRARGEPFMPMALARYHPPLLLANRPLLDPDKSAFQQLLPADRALIQQHYLRYWGPIFVAGGRLRVTDRDEHLLRLPFGGRYRLTTNQDVMVNGEKRQTGDILEVADDATRLAISPLDAGSQGRALELQLMWAAAGPPPSQAPPTKAPYVLF
ncbi:ArnT family glycosyltransferase [Pseudoxanthomonas dokdonensis]|uniref:Uncharacterized protein n=1 Tax=Pseudoxanthomonas dokdonensis TaxID=344882 RepID=A0A0R0CXW7_9GAMM|nr:glycosyltransferase family 39 protein [Pseudoxanthomonas dokdonensis]KRG69960.1 hypothetical protein ABB29_06855 [Pseudoxanthomonas dokdonensis]